MYVSLLENIIMVENIITNIIISGIMSMSLQNYYRFNLRSSVLPSHSSNFELEDSIELKESFWKRLINFFKTWQKIYIWSTVFINKQQEIAERYFGKDIPHILDIAKNMSLILINQEALLSYSRPEIPNVIHFSGLHIIKNPPAPSQVRSRLFLKLCLYHYRNFICDFLAFQSNVYHIDRYST